ncbi:hypothetical protein T484DRAFT_1876120 [Baffinella frigidus]|nr:hypothetical protein T484DRAFT_1876120 [Cryptophyta sp. CCMP2293]
MSGPPAGPNVAGVPTDPPQPVATAGGGSQEAGAAAAAAPAAPAKGVLVNQAEASLADLSRAEGQLVGLLNTAAAILQALLARLNGTAPTEDVEKLTLDYVTAVERSEVGRRSGTAPTEGGEKLTLDYVTAVEAVRDMVSSMLAVRDMVSSMLVGGTERLHYRPFQRSVYGPLLDLEASADSVTHVHTQLSDLKATLQGMVPVENHPAAAAAPSLADLKATLQEMVPVEHPPPRCRGPVGTMNWFNVSA